MSNQQTFDIYCKWQVSSCSSYNFQPGYPCGYYLMVAAVIKKPTMMWLLCKPLVTISHRNLTRTTMLPAHFLSVRVAALLYKVNNTSRITCMNKLETDNILTSPALSLSRVVSHSYIQAFCLRFWYCSNTIYGTAQAQRHTRMLSHTRSIANWREMAPSLLVNIHTVYSEVDICMQISCHVPLISVYSSASKILACCA